MSTLSTRFRWLLALFLLFGTFSAGAQKAKPQCYAKIELSHTPKFVGDSCLVNIVLYANLPFVEFKSKDTAKQKIKGGTLRHTADGAVNHQQQVRDNGQTMFAFIARQYVLRCESAGKVELPAQNFEVQLGTYVIEENPYDFFSSSRLRLVERHRLKAKSPQQTLEIEERPKRTTREVMRSGQQVI